jgi:hypothetical protein
VHSQIIPGTGKVQLVLLVKPCTTNFAAQRTGLVGNIFFILKRDRDKVQYERLWWCKSFIRNVQSQQDPACCILLKLKYEAALVTEAFVLHFLAVFAKPPKLSHKHIATRPSIMHLPKTISNKMWVFIVLSTCKYGNLFKVIDYPRQIHILLPGAEKLYNLWHRVK